MSWLWGPDCQKLTAREYRILELRVAGHRPECTTIAKIADDVNLSPQRVRTLLRKTMWIVRNRLVEK